MASLMHILEILAHVVTLPLHGACGHQAYVLLSGAACVLILCLPHIMENYSSTVPLDVPLWVTSNRFITLQIDSCKSEHNEIKIMCVLV